MNTEYYLVNTASSTLPHTRVDAQPILHSFTSRDVLEHPLEVHCALNPRSVIDPQRLPVEQLLRNHLKQELTGLLESVDTRVMFQLEQLVELLHPKSQKTFK